jgi:hypothetical protein
LSSTIRTVLAILRIPSIAPLPRAGGLAMAGGTVVGIPYRNGNFDEC